MNGVDFLKVLENISINMDQNQEDFQILFENNNVIQGKGSPLLKWPGGKRFLLKNILPFVPKKFNKFYEPFLGGGALFFSLEPNHSILSDKNSELINCYVQVRDNAEQVINHLNTLNNTEDDYYRIRSKVPTNKVDQAARFIYLTTLSFNGIYRENLKGEFNVPYGYRTHLKPCDESKIRSVSATLAHSKLNCMDFQDSVSDAQEGDLIYFDPPYTVAHNNNGFVKYNSKIFSWNDQIRLSQLAKSLVNRGCKVIISNANHPSILELYEEFSCQIVERSSVIAASGKHRKNISECIFYKGV